MNVSSCINHCPGSFVSFLYVYVKILVIFSPIFLGCLKKKFISSTFHTLAHNLRVFSGHCAKFGNFDNLPNLDILLIIVFFYINLTRHSGKWSQNCLSRKAIQFEANALSILYLVKSEMSTDMMVARWKIMGRPHYCVIPVITASIWLCPM